MILVPLNFLWLDCKIPNEYLIFILLKTDGMALLLIFMNTSPFRLLLQLLYSCLDFAVFDIEVSCRLPALDV